MGSVGEKCDLLTKQVSVDEKLARHQLRPKFVLLKGDKRGTEQVGKGRPMLLFTERRSKQHLVIYHWISNQARGPAEFKHISKRRKRN
jgi:hypothetical protein